MLILSWFSLSSSVIFQHPQIIQFCHWPYLVVFYCLEYFQFILHPAYQDYQNILFLHPEFQYLYNIITVHSLWCSVLIFGHYQNFQKLVLLHPAFTDLQKIFLVNLLRQTVLLFGHWHLTLNPMHWWRILSWRVHQLQ